MKRIISFFLMVTLSIVLGILFSSCTEAKEAGKKDAKQINQSVVTTETEDNITQALEKLKPGDPIQVKVESLSWQLRYYQERQRAIQLEYTGLCYKDPRHAQCVLEIEKLTKEIRRLLLGGY